MLQLNPMSVTKIERFFCLRNRDVRGNSFENPLDFRVWDKYFCHIHLGTEIFHLLLWQSAFMREWAEKNFIYQIAYAEGEGYVTS